MEPLRHETMMMEDYDIVNDIIDSMMDVYEELDGSKKYIMEAFRFKDQQPEMASKLVTMSSEEKKHADNIAEGIDAMLDKAKREENPCYDTLHKVWVHIKARQDGYRSWIEHMHEKYKK